MNIGVVCYHTVGGSGTVAYELGAFLARKGGDYQMHFIGLHPPFRWDDTVPNMTFHNIEIIEYPVFVHQPYTLALASRIAQVARDYELEIVHIHYAIPHAVAALLARDMTEHRFKVVTTLHGTDINLVGKHPSFFNITRHAILRSDAITCVSESLRSQTEEIFGIPSGRIKVISNFVAQERCENVAIPQVVRDSPPGSPVLVHASNLRDVKRPMDLIEVAKRLRERGCEDFKLLIIGDGPRRFEMEQLTKKYKIESHVDFLGNVQALEGFFKCADIFLLTSELESFGLAALEAMACETAVVGYKVGGLPEVVNNESGCLVPLRDVDAITEQCLKLFQDRSKLDRMKRAARLHALETFESRKIVPQYEQLYHELVGK